MIEVGDNPRTPARCGCVIQQLHLVAGWQSNLVGVECRDLGNVVKHVGSNFSSFMSMNDYNEQSCYLSGHMLKFLEFGEDATFSVEEVY